MTLLRQATTSSWPNTVPVKCRDDNPVKGAWLRCTTQWSVVFHAFIYATTLHLRCAYKGCEWIYSATTNATNKGSVSSMLFEILQAGEGLHCWDPHGQVLLWTLTSGEIAASSMAPRGLYVQQLRRHISSLQVKEWLALETICLKHLWWKPVCSPAGQNPWCKVYPTDGNSGEVA